MSQLAYLQPSAQIQRQLPPTAAGEGDVSGCAGDWCRMRPWVGFSVRHTFAKRAHGAPEMFGICQKSPARAVAVQFPGQTLHHVLAAPLLAPFLPNSPPSVTARAFLDVSYCTIWALFKAEKPIFGALDTSNFSTEFPPLLQPHDRGAGVPCSWVQSCIAARTRCITPHPGGFGPLGNGETCFCTVPHPCPLLLMSLWFCCGLF